MRIIDSMKLKMIRIRLERKVKKRDNLERIGSFYGGWMIPIDLLNENSICYCAGVGEDITFDLALIDRYSCQVFAFDPTPRAISYVEQKTSNIPNYQFYPIGLWTTQQKMRFYSPKNPSHVSHSITNIQQTETFFEAECKRLFQLMSELNHNRIDLLKLDIEGAEYEVLETIIEDKLNIGIICVEFHKPLKNVNFFVKKLIDWKFNLISADSLFNCTFCEKKFSGG
ncbi:MAG: FkbM family methyltransferase [Candidatus Hodarchaeota archaeon]